MNNLTEKDIEVLGTVLRAEEMACKKARVYANTLTDPALSEEMGKIAKAHEERFCALYRILGGAK